MGLSTLPYWYVLNFGLCSFTHVFLYNMPVHRNLIWRVSCLMRRNWRGQDQPVRTITPEVSPANGYDKDQNDSWWTNEQIHSRCISCLPELWYHQTRWRQDLECVFGDLYLKMPVRKQCWAYNEDKQVEGRMKGTEAWQATTLNSTLYVAALHSFILVTDDKFIKLDVIWWKNKAVQRHRHTLWRETLDLTHFI